MAKLLPLNINIEAAMCMAIQQRAANEGISPSEVVNAILRQALTPEVASMSSVPTLTSLIQHLHTQCRSRSTNGAHRPVTIYGKHPE